MISELKRNKSLIRSLQNYLYKYFTSEGYVYSAAYCKLVLSKDIYFELLINYIIDVRENKLIAVEDDRGRVNIGVDTSKVKLDFREGHLWMSPDKSICNYIFGAEKNYISNAYMYKLQRAIIDRLIADGDQDSISKTTGRESTYNAIRESKLYKEAMNALEYTKYNYKAWLELEENNFKFVKNRKFIPVAILDFDKGTLNYCTDSSVESDRKKRDTSLISVFSSKGEIVFDTSRGYVRGIKIPLRLSTLFVDSKYLEKLII